MNYKNWNKMETTLQTNKKRSYHSPVIEQIMLDNEISLALESEPPAWETKSDFKAPEYFNNDPFKMG